MRNTSTRIERARRLRARALELGVDRGTLAATPDAELHTITLKWLALAPHLVDDVDAQPSGHAQVLAFPTRAHAGPFLGGAA